MMKLIAATVLLLAISGCQATHNVSDGVQFFSTPAGANIDIGQVGRCVAPCTLYLERGHSYLAVVTRPGCEITALTIIGYVDPTTQALRQMLPNPAYTTLVCEKN